MKSMLVGLTFAALVGSGAQAAPVLLHEYVGMKAVPSALVNLEPIEVDPSCGNRIGAITISGVQLSPSGGTVDLFWFVDRNGTRWGVPTGIKDQFGTADRGDANNLFQVGGKYWVHIQVCGSGGVTSLISIYDMRFTFGVKEGAQ